MLVSFTAASENLRDVLMFYPQTIRSEHNNQTSQVTVNLRLGENVIKIHQVDQRTRIFVFHQIQKFCSLLLQPWRKDRHGRNRLHVVSNPPYQNLLIRCLQSRVLRSEANEELVCWVAQQVLDLLGLVDENGTGLVDVLYEGDETVPVPGTGVLHHKLLVPVQPEQDRRLHRYVILEPEGQNFQLLYVYLNNNCQLKIHLNKLYKRTIKTTKHFRYRKK